jgi:hypothetical protein
MTKFRRLAFMAMVLSLVPASRAYSGGDVLFVFGSRTLDSDAEPVEDQDAYGVFAFLKQDDWPISFAMGFESSEETATGTRCVAGFQCEVKGELIEGYIGVGKVFEKFGGLRPFVGGGLTVLGVDARERVLATGVEGDDDDTLLAPYVHTGVFWRIGKWLDLGLGLRYVFFAETTLQPFDFLPPQEADINYLQYNALIGWGW